MADSNIVKKSGLAWSAYLTSAGVTATIVVGEGNTDKALPLVSVISVSSNVIEGQEFTGNREVTTEIAVVANAHDEANTGAFAALVQQVGDLVNTTTLAADLTAALAGFTCIGVINVGESNDTDGDVMRSTFTLALLCCPSDLTP